MPATIPAAMLCKEDENAALTGENSLLSLSLKSNAQDYK